MILECGVYIEIRRAGIDADRPHVTAHDVYFWASDAAHDAGDPPVCRHDVLIPWNGPHDRPASFVAEVLNGWVLSGGMRMSGEHLKASLKWADGPDTHGILGHPSMAALTPVST